MRLIEINSSGNNLDEEVEIASEEAGAKVFRNIIEQKRIMKNLDIKKQKTADLCKELYDSMSESGRHIVNSAILDFIPEEMQKQNFGEYFTELMSKAKSLNDESLTLYKMAQFIYAKNVCSRQRDEDGSDIEYYYEDVEVLRAKLKSLQKKEKSIDKSFNLELDVCSLLSCELDVLTEGIGKKYDIDWKSLEVELDKNQMDVNSFFEDAVSQYIKCNSCEFLKKEKVCEQQEKYIGFLMFDKYSYGRFLARLLGVDEEKILNEIEITFFDDEFPFEKYYKKLSKDIQMHINNLIRNVYLVENLVE